MFRKLLRNNLWLKRDGSNLQNVCNKNSETSKSSVKIELCDVYQLYNLDESPKSSVSLTRNEAREYYTSMQTIRRMENAIAGLYRSKEIRGFCHLYIGQEACCVGMKASMRPMDTVITSYRSHGWTHLMGVSVRDLIAEVIQRQMGCTRGKGGSMHTYGKNFYGGNGIVGAQVPLGVGVALAHAYRKDGGVNFAIYGDGAANQGQIFEAYNMACLWKLPVVFVCENNKYGMGTSVVRSSCSTAYFTRGDYIPGIWVNAMDVLAVRSATEFVIEHALNKGPIVMELETYRYVGHSMSDPGVGYRDRDEINDMRKNKDAIENMKNICLKNNFLTEEDIKKLDEEIKNEIAEDVKEAREGKLPDLEELWCDVSLNNLEKPIRGIVYRDLKHKNIGHLLNAVGAPKATPRSEITLPEPPKPKPAKEGDPKAGEGSPEAKGDKGAEATLKPKTDGTPDTPKAANDTAAPKAEGEAKPKDASSASKSPKEDPPSNSSPASNDKPKNPPPSEPST